MRMPVYGYTITHGTLAVSRKPAASLRSILKKPAAAGRTGIEKSDRLKVHQWTMKKDSFPQCIIEYEKGLHGPGKQSARASFINSVIERKADGSYQIQRKSPFFEVCGFSFLSAPF